MLGCKIQPTLDVFEDFILQLGWRMNVWKVSAEPSRNIAVFLLTTGKGVQSCPRYAHQTPGHSVTVASIQRGELPWEGGFLSFTGKYTADLQVVQAPAKSSLLSLRAQHLL